MAVDNAVSAEQETLLEGMIADSARSLDLDLSGSEVCKARAIAQEALACGYGVDTSFEFARRVLLEGFEVDGAVNAA